MVLLLCQVWVIVSDCQVVVACYPHLVRLQTDWNTSLSLLLMFSLLWSVRGGLVGTAT